MRHSQTLGSPGRPFLPGRSDALTSDRSARLCVAALGRAQPVAVGILILFCLYLALYHAAFGLLLGLLTRTRAFANARALLVAPVLWVAVEHSLSLGFWGVS